MTPTKVPPGPRGLPFVGNLPCLAAPNQGKRKQRLIIMFSPDGVIPGAFWLDAQYTSVPETGTDLGARLRTLSGTHVVPEPMLSLRVRGGLPMTVHLASGARLLNEPSPGAGGHLYVFVHPASTGGVLLELIQESET